MAKKKIATKKAARGSPGDDKTPGFVAYLTFVGLIIAAVLNNDRKSEYVKWHIKQSLLLTILWLIISVIPFWSLGLFFGVKDVLYVLLFVLWLIPFIGAINGDKKEIPWIGRYAQEWFTF